MSRHALLALSAASSAFVLVIAGAAASYALRPAPSSSADTHLRGHHAVPHAIASPRPQAAVSAPVFERDDEDEARDIHTARTAHREDDDG